jgi:hypothetical protein
VRANLSALSNANVVERGANPLPGAEAKNTLLAPSNRLQERLSFGAIDTSAGLSGVHHSQKSVQFWLFHRPERLRAACRPMIAMTAATNIFSVAASGTAADSGSAEGSASPLAAV